MWNKCGAYVGSISLLQYKTLHLEAKAKIKERFGACVIHFPDPVFAIVFLRFFVERFWLAKFFLFRKWNCGRVVVPWLNASRSPTFPRSPLREFSRLAWILAATMQQYFYGTWISRGFPSFRSILLAALRSLGTDFASVRTYFPRKSGKTDAQDGSRRRKNPRDRSISE